MCLGGCFQASAVGMPALVATLVWACRSPNKPDLVQGLFEKQGVPTLEESAATRQQGSTVQPSKLLVCLQSCYEGAMRAPPTVRGGSAGVGRPRVSALAALGGEEAEDALWVVLK